MTMLHLACKHNPPPDVVELLLDANPSASFLKSLPYGEIPLHFALGRNMANVEVIKLLVKAYPRSVSLKVCSMSCFWSI